MAGKKLAHTEERTMEHYLCDFVLGLDPIVWEREPATFQITFVGKGIETLLGYPAQRWLTEPNFWAECIHPEDRDRVLAEYRQALWQEKIREVEFRAVAADGRVVWLRDRLQKVGEGTLQRLRGFLVEIPNRQPCEIALQKIEQKSCIAGEPLHECREREFKAIADILPVVIFRTDRELRCTYINPAIEETTGIAPHAFTGKTLQEIWRERSIELLQWEEAVRTVFLTHQQQSVELNFPRKTGEMAYFCVRLLPELGADGSVETVLGIAREIAAQKRADNERERDRLTPELNPQRQPTATPPSQESQAIFDALIDSAPVGIGFHDRQLRFVRVNDCLAAINGVPASEHIGRTLGEVLPEAIASRVSAILQRVLDTGEPISNVQIGGETFASPGQQRYWLANYYPARSESGEILGVGVAVADITDLKQIEQALRASEERFRVAQELSLDAFTILKSVRSEKGEIVDFAWEYVNPKAAEILQHSAEYLTGKRLLEVLPGNKTNSELFDRYVRVVEIAEAHDIEIPYTAEGINGWFRNMAVKLGDGVAISFSDITDRKRSEEEMQRREHEFKALVENAPDIISRIDRDCRHLYVNPAIKKATGIAPENFLGKNYAELGVPQEIYKCWEENFRKIFATGQEMLVEFDFPSPSGRRYYQSRMVPELDRDGTVKTILGISRDVTEYKQVEQALRESEARFRRVVESHAIGMGCWDISGNVTAPNDALLKLLGYSPEDFPTGGLNWQALTPPEHAPLDERAIQECRESGICTPFEKEFVRADGSRVPVLLGAAMFEGSTDSGVFFALDLTERKRTEKALKESEERLRLSLEAGRMGIWDWNILTGEVKWSDNLETIHGMAPGTFAGSFEKFLEIIHLEDREMVKGAIAAAVDNKTEYDLEFRVVTAPGSIRWIAGKGKTFCDETGKAVRMLGVGMDISDRANAKIALQQQAQELEEANRIKDEFLAVLSHELRSPLNAILGWAQLLRSRKFNEATTASALETIERNARLQTQLVEDLLDISRLLRGKLSLEVSEVNLASVIQASVDNLRLAAIAKCIEIATFVEPAVGKVAGDPLRLQQVIWNLLSNAIKFTPDGGRVEIRLSVELANREWGTAIKPMPNAPSPIPHALIQVTDTGQGIAAEFLPNVFDYFRQADSSTTRHHGGLGLGLAIARHIVELHGGTISADSPGEGQGATFTVRLPFSQSPEKRMFNAENHYPQSIEHSMLNALSGLRVLVVDDEPDTRDVLAATLQESGALVTAVASVAEAFCALEGFAPDVLVSDIGMPEQDGYALIRQLRATDPGKQIPAAALTAYASEEDRLKALEAGFQTHLSKPVEPDDLVAAIANLVKLESCD